MDLARPTPLTGSIDVRVDRGRSLRITQVNVYAQVGL